MAALASPLPAAEAPVVAPPTPAAPAAAPIQPGSVHGPEDAIQNRLLARMSQAPAATPAPAVPTAAPANPNLSNPNTPEGALAAANAPAAPVAAPIAAPVSAPEPVATPVEQKEVSLDDVDFDAQPDGKAGDLPSDRVSTPANTPDSEIETSLSEMLARNELPEKIEEVLLRHSRGRQMLTAFKTQRDLAKPPAEGGLGHIPSVEQIRGGDAALRQMTALRYEAENDPLSLSRNFFTLNPQNGLSFIGSPEQTAKVLNAIPEALFSAAAESGNPAHAQLIEAYSAPVFNRFFDHQYKNAMALPESNQQEQDFKYRMLDGLQMSEYAAFGKARPLNLQAGATQPSSNQPDPEKAALLAQVRSYEQQTNQMRSRTESAARTAVDANRKTAAMGDIGQVIKQTGVANVYPEAVLAPFREGLYAEVEQALPAFNPSGWQQYQLELRNAVSGRVDPAVPANTFRQLFREALRGSTSVRTKVNELVQGAKQRSDAQHAQRQESQLRTEPNGTGQALQSSVLPSSPQLVRQPSESQEDFYARRLTAASQKVLHR